MPLRLCPTPGCGNTTTRGKCPSCRREAAREHGPRPYDKRQYKRNRKRVIAGPCQCPGCSECTHLWNTTSCDRIATDADHIIPVSDGGDPVAVTNLRGMCRPCHIERHRKGVRDASVFWYSER
jgi:hypothetical protein